MIFSLKRRNQKRRTSLRGHVVMEGMSRPERKLLLRAEARARSSGDWGPWEKFEFPHGTVGAG